jgi:hypothetical protein
MSGKFFRLFGMLPPWRPAVPLPGPSGMPQPPRPAVPLAAPSGMPRPPPHSPEWHFKNATSVQQQMQQQMHQMQQQMRQHQDALAAHQRHQPAPTVAIDEFSRTSRKPALTVVINEVKRHFSGVHRPMMPEPGGFDQGFDPSVTADVEGGIAALEVNTDEMLAMAERAAIAAIERGDEIDTMLTNIRAVRAETTAV